jgi:hypothetical protein
MSYGTYVIKDTLTGQNRRALSITTLPGRKHPSLLLKGPGEGSWEVVASFRSAHDADQVVSFLDLLAEVAE